jgi:hypothetical protein
LLRATEKLHIKLLKMKKNIIKKFLLSVAINSKNLEIYILLMTLILLIIWALPHTIALRNIALFSGAFAGILWVYLENPDTNKFNLLPICFLIAVPLWVLIHWKFFSNLKDIQWDELNSTWLRVIVGITLGFCAGQIINKNKYLFIILAIGICILPLITSYLYIVELIIQKKWVLNNFLGLFKAKFSASYFIACQILLGFSCITYIFINKEKYVNEKIYIGFFGSTIIVIGIIDAIAIRSLNLVLLSFISFIVLLIVTTLNFKVISLSTSKNLLNLLISTIFLILIIFYIYYLYDAKYEGKLKNLLNDISISTQIDNNFTWVSDGRSASLPVDENGRKVNVSTYERVSWMIRGAQFIIEKPLGNGVIAQSFGYFMREKYPGSTVLVSHSGWVDFALATGLPGLLFTWAAILLCVFGIRLEFIRKKNVKIIEESININLSNESLKYKKELMRSLISATLINNAKLWIIGGLSLFWIISEVSEREYIEHYFFLVALFSQVNYSDKSVINKYNC